MKLIENLDILCGKSLIFLYNYLIIRFLTLIIAKAVYFFLSTAYIYLYP